jgi:hypothetical protein
LPATTKLGTELIPACRPRCSSVRTAIARGVVVERRGRLGSVETLGFGNVEQHRAVADVAP